MGGLPGDDGRQEETEESIPLKWEMCEACDDFIIVIVLDPNFQKDRNPEMPGYYQTEVRKMLTHRVG